MTISDGFRESFLEGKVAKLKRALYGLRQAPRAWYSKINNCLTKNLSLKKETSDPNLYFSFDKKWYAVILLYVDDLIVINDNHEQINHLIEQLHREFEITSLGRAAFYLTTELTYTNEGIYVH